jgi:hypothetical protein
MASVVEVIWVKSEGAIFLQGGLDSESVICPTGEFAKRRADHQRRRHGRAKSRPSTSFPGRGQDVDARTRPGMAINSMFVIPERDLVRAAMRNCASENPEPLCSSSVIS